MSIGELRNGDNPFSAEVIYKEGNIIINNMSTWQIIAIVYGIITIITFFVGVIAFFDDGLKEKRWTWGYLLIGAFFVPFLIFLGLIHLQEYLTDVWEDRGFYRHYRKIRERKMEDERREEEYNRIANAYEKGELRRDELPRIFDGLHHFELYGKLLDGDDWQELVYIENEYNEVFNTFFKRHPFIKLNHDVRIVYLPQSVQSLTNEDVLLYWNPGIKDGVTKSIGVDTSSLLDELCYPEDSVKLTHGLISCFGWTENHKAKTYRGTYYPLNEGSDDEIFQQLEIIAKEAISDNIGGMYCSVKRPSKDDLKTENFADEQFNWEINELVDEIRERVEKLEQRGISRKLLMNLITEKQELSRLVITKDMRIMLPDYNMEIKMEPINKAVFFLFLRHPEGIIFKHLPNYRKELTDIYQMIKPCGINERVLQSIEDVTNPLLNSINEKCARIRGSFISQFDENIAKSYYIFGTRGEPKKIDLPRDLVIWE